MTQDANYPIFTVDRNIKIIPRTLLSVKITGSVLPSIFGFLFVRFGRGLLEHYIGKHGIEIEKCDLKDAFIQSYLEYIYTNFLLLCLTLVSTHTLWLVLLMGLAFINTTHFNRKVLLNPWPLSINRARAQEFVGIFNKDKEVRSHFQMGRKLAINLKSLSLDTVVFKRLERKRRVRGILNKISGVFKND